MNCPNGDTIKRLRTEKNMTQKQLADILSVSEKTVSKWETGKGLPDVGILSALAKTLGVSVSELFSGEISTNRNTHFNMLKLCVYVCPICGNIVFSAGEGSFSCCGTALKPLKAKECDTAHNINIDFIENEYYVSVAHEMTKENYISALCLVTADRIQTVKLYPEQSASAVFSKCGHGRIYALCTKHGMFEKKI